jgi:hypothetical protein
MVEFRLCAKKKITEKECRLRQFPDKKNKIHRSLKMGVSGTGGHLSLLWGGDQKDCQGPDLCVYCKCNQIS